MLYTQWQRVTLRPVRDALAITDVTDLSFTHQIMKLFQQSLSTGWEFKDRDDNTPNPWMSVPSVPSVVQQDLIANKKCDTIPTLNVDKLIDFAQTRRSLRGVQ